VSETIARRAIEESGWNVVALEEVQILERADYDDNHSEDGLAAFNEAKKVGYYFQFHTFPIGEHGDAA